LLIPSLRGGRRLLETSSALVAAGVEVIVADNGLPGPVAARLRAAGVVVADMGMNRGFGGAVNRAAKASTGEVLVVSNDDVLIDPRFLARLCVPFSHGAGVVAGVLLEEGRPHVIESAGIEVDAALSPYDYLQGQPVARLEMPPPPPLGPCGGAAAYARDAFLAVGGFDEGFFAYGEDVDLALRLRRLGASCALAADARALHATSSTLGYESLAKATLVGYSRGYLLRKYGILTSPPSAARAVTIEAAVSLVLLSRHGSLQPLAARVRGWRNCRARAPRPPRSVATVGLVDGLRRRYARSNRASGYERR
jgi:GT2 family glycosyltransferase